MAKKRKCMSQELQHYWQYFLMIEDDLAATARYVEFDQSNMETFSAEFSRIILSAGSETDVLAKVLCDQHTLKAKNGKSVDGIADYRETIVPRFQGFTKLEIWAPRMEMRTLPWSNWDKGLSPKWWTEYNEIKHKRHRNFAKANLRNAIDGVAGLFVMVAYVCQHELRGNRLAPMPKMLSLDPELSSRVRSDLRACPEFS